MAMTDFSNICSILGKLYFNYQEDENFVDFIDYNDIGLPLAYLSSENLCEPSDDGKRYIMETWDLFLAALEIEDKGFTDLDDLFNAAGNNK
jgi:hypothetical protein